METSGAACTGVPGSFKKCDCCQKQWHFLKINTDQEMAKSVDKLWAPGQFALTLPPFQNTPVFLNLKGIGIELFHSPPKFSPVPRYTFECVYRI
jgi:hypothetical protein